MMAGPAHRPFGIVLIRLRMAETDQHPVAHILGDKAVEAADRIGDGAVVVADQLAQILRVMTGSRAQSSRRDRKTSPSAAGVRPRLSEEGLEQLSGSLLIEPYNTSGTLPPERW